VIIPAGSQIEGVLKPQNGGSQFIAQTLTINGESFPIAASSGVVTRVRNTRDINLLSLARNSALGAGVAAGISGLAGDRTITAEKVISGAAAGATIGGAIDRPKLSQVVVIEPNTDLTLSLDKQLVMAQR
jgi:hypothetical protein